MRNDFILSPSLLSCDFARLADEAAALKDAGVTWLHLDVMDGAFVPNMTFGPPIIAALRKHSDLFFDVHLMIEKPERYIQQFADAGADLIGVHAEASIHLERTVSAIKEAGCQACVALNPHTPLSQLQYILPELDMVLIMSVNPGFGGQSFLPFSYEKIETLAELAQSRNPALRIQVDGGVTPENTPELVRKGADTLVSGSAFFNHPPYAERLKVFEAAAKI